VGALAVLAMLLAVAWLERVPYERQANKSAA
jgi:hypothetical protein